MTHSDPKAEAAKKIALDTLRPLLADLETVNVIAEFTVSTEEGRALISATVSLVKGLISGSRASRTPRRKTP